MLDPRIYRMGLIPVVLAVIVLAFSLGNEAGPLSTTLAPGAYDGSNAYATMTTLAAQFPRRAPGSSADQAIAGFVKGKLNGYGFATSTERFRGVTASGPRRLENVIGIRAGQENGSIVVVAARDGAGTLPSARRSQTCGGCAQLSGTAVLLELARVLSGETLQHTLVLASTTGTSGAAGALALARELPQPVDAVIVLGDLAGTTTREPTVIPWSNGAAVAPTLLRDTVGAAFAGQTGLPAGAPSLLSQLAHLVLPMAPSGQAPLDASGDPAVLVSLSGERAPSPNEATSVAQITGAGQAVLQAVNALDGGPTVPSPSTYLSFSGQTVPAWAVRLLALALILPVLMAAIDGLARARRRGHPVLRWVMWVLAAATPFVLCALIVRGAQAVGAISAAPAVPLDGGMFRLDAGELALLAVLGALIVLGVTVLRPFAAARMGLRRRGETKPYDEGAAAGVLLVLCAVALALWLANPFAALLLVPALHLWMWIVVPEVKLPLPAVVVLAAAGLALPMLVAAQYAISLGLTPLQAAWSWVLLIGGGGFGLVSTIEWSLFLGCTAAVFAVAARSARQPRPEPVSVTIRGPVTYAGPGSLGGTKSALRR